MLYIFLNLHNSTLYFKSKHKCYMTTCQPSKHAYIRIYIYFNNFITLEKYPLNAYDTDNLV